MQTADRRGRRVPQSHLVVQGRDAVRRPPVARDRGRRRAAPRRARGAVRPADARRPAADRGGVRRGPARARVDAPGAGGLRRRARRRRGGGCRRPDGGGPPPGSSSPAGLDGRRPGAAAGPRRPRARTLPPAPGPPRAAARGSRRRDALRLRGRAGARLRPGARVLRRSRARRRGPGHRFGGRAAVRVPEPADRHGTGDRRPGRHDGPPEPPGGGDRRATACASRGTSSSSARATSTSERRPGRRTSVQRRPFALQPGSARADAFRASRARTASSGNDGAPSRHLPLEGKDAAGAFPHRRRDGNAPVAVPADRQAAARLGDSRGHSSAGRAPALQAGGQGFDPPGSTGGIAWKSAVSCADSAKGRLAPVGSSTRRRAEARRSGKWRAGPARAAGRGVAGTGEAPRLPVALAEAGCNHARP